jgi:hypothetical protein
VDYAASVPLHLIHEKDGLLATRHIHSGLASVPWTASE